MIPLERGELTNRYIMSTIEKDFKELYELQGDAFEQRLIELKGIYTSQQDREKITEILLSHMDETIEEMKIIDDQLTEMTIKKQLQDVAEIVSLSYIAKHYFGRTRQWLYQRINGNPVRGKVYTLNAKEKDILNNALQDISKKIGSLSVI